MFLRSCCVQHRATIPRVHRAPHVQALGKEEKAEENKGKSTADLLKEVRRHTSPPPSSPPPLHSLSPDAGGMSPHACARAQMYADADEDGKAALSKAWEEGREKREGRKKVT